VRERHILPGADAEIRISPATRQNVIEFDKTRTAVAKRAPARPILTP
jgi:hypothetical protein